MKVDDETMLKIHDSLARYVTTLIDQQHDPLAVAAVMTKISLEIYRSVLSHEDYHAMVDEISARRDQIQPLVPTNSTDQPLH